MGSTIRSDRREIHWHLIGNYNFQQTHASSIRFNCLHKRIAHSTLTLQSIHKQWLECNIRRAMNFRLHSHRIASWRRSVNSNGIDIKFTHLFTILLTASPFAANTLRSAAPNSNPMLHNAQHRWRFHQRRPYRSIYLLLCFTASNRITVQ